jgi:hypothetical protein
VADKGGVLCAKMGIPTFCRDYLKKNYMGAFSFSLSGAQQPTVCVLDLMSEIKWLPETIVTLEQALLYFTNKVKTYLYHTNYASIQTMIVCVDRKPPVVKGLVTHEKRYKNKDVLPSKGGPYLPSRGSDPVPTPWIKFAGNHKLLRRELYPRLFNALMQLPLKPGQKLILHGFPAYTEWITVYKQQAYSLGTNENAQVLQIHEWTLDQLPISSTREKQDPQLYDRIYFLENVPPCPAFPQGAIMRQQWEEATNAINEADGALFFYDHWFQHQTMLLACNDGDVFAYGLLYAYERTTLHNTFRNQHIVQLPYKKTKESEAFPPGNIPKYEYCDLNALYCLVKEDAAMKAAGVQNHVVTLVFLLIMAGSDFFQNHLKGIGAEKGIWQPFLSSLSTYSHLVQSSKGVEPSSRPETKHGRTIVLDEERFRIFVVQCYAEKYGGAARKRLKRDPSFEDVRVQCNSGAKAATDPDYQMPTRNKIRLWARQVLWNLLYYRNAPFDRAPDPFETSASDGLPYFPYVHNPATGKPEMSPVVSAHEKPIDDVYRQHMFGRE